MLTGKIQTFLKEKFPVRIVSRTREGKMTGNVLPDLFHVDGFSRADIYAGLAVNTHVLVHFCLIIFHGDCRRGTFAHTGFASGTLIEINDSYQLVHSIVYISQKTKKGFRLDPAGIPLEKWLFFEAEHIAHAVDAGFFAYNPPGCMKSTAGKDRTIRRMV